MLGGATEADGARIQVKVTDLRNADGVVRACITRDPKAFPDCDKGAVAEVVAMPDGSTASLSFGGIAPGRYAIVLLHDENNNRKMDRALMMMPKEGYGFSRDAKVRMGPPKFRDAVFDVTTQDQAQTIRMRYMF